MRFLLATWGSSGDLNPFLALGVELQKRGHVAALVGNPLWRETVEAAGLRFLPAGPEQSIEFLFGHPEILSQRRLGIPGFRALMKRGVAPVLESMYQVLVEAAPHYDCLVTHFVLPVGRMAAERTGIPWASATLAPGMIPSRYTLPAGAWMAPRRGPLGRAFNQTAWLGARAIARPIMDPITNQLRLRHGFTAVKNALFTSFSPRLNLLLYSPVFSPPAPDWGAGQVCAGFCFEDRHTPVASRLPETLEKFLHTGPPPLLFTLGSSAIASAQGFYEAALGCARGSDWRAVILIGDERNRPAGPVPENVCIQAYAPYAVLMPACAAVAHQCGIGTTAHTLRAGVPSVAVPFAFDQPGIAATLQELGVAHVIYPWQRRSIDAFTRQLRKKFTALLASGAPAKARSIARRVADEDGPAKACQALERFVRHVRGTN